MQLNIVGLRGRSSSPLMPRTFARWPGCSRSLGPRWSNEANRLRTPHFGRRLRPVGRRLLQHHPPISASQPSTSRVCFRCACRSAQMAGTGARLNECSWPEAVRLHSAGDAANGRYSRRNARQTRHVVPLQQTIKHPQRPVRRRAPAQRSRAAHRHRQSPARAPDGPSSGDNGARDAPPPVP